MDILDVLTPDLTPNQIKELKRRLRDAEKNAKINKSQYDPRVVNLPLPNDAKITYKYGARAYESDLYDGFVWRNGVWYNTKDLNFVPSKCDDMKNNSIANYRYGTIYSNITVSLVGVNIDDTFYPCILNGQRIFIHENWTNGSPCDVFIYEPLSQQIFISSVSLCRALNKNMTYEDKKNMNHIPIGYMPIKYD